MARTLWMVALAVTLAACGPNPQQPVKVMALVAKTQTGYQPEQVELTSLKDVVAMKGDVASFIGGARIVINPQDPLLAGDLSDDQFKAAVLKDKGSDVHASYIEKDGVLWPADFHTWNMVTTYFNFEKAFGYFKASGVPSTELGTASVYYFPSFIVSDASPDPQKDNAIWASPVTGFLILPFDKLQKVPLPMNGGIIAHEYSHRVFNQRVFKGRGQPEPYVRWIGSGVSAGINLLKALDEGLADYHAYGATCLSSGCNPRFLADAVPQDIADARDLAKPDRCLSTAQRNQLESQSAGDFTGAGMEYRVGTVLASALYQAGEISGQRQDLQRAVLAAYADVTASKPGFAELVTSNLDTPQNFQLESVAEAIASHIDDATGLRKEVCRQLVTRLKLNVDSPIAPMPSCRITYPSLADCTGVQ